MQRHLYFERTLSSNKNKPNWELIPNQPFANINVDELLNSQIVGLWPFNDEQTVKLFTRISAYDLSNDLQRKLIDLHCSEVDDYIYAAALTDLQEHVVNNTIKITNMLTSLYEAMGMTVAIDSNFDIIDALHSNEACIAISKNAMLNIIYEINNVYNISRLETICLAGQNYTSDKNDADNTWLDYDVRLIVINLG